MTEEQTEFMECPQCYKSMMTLDKDKRFWRCNKCGNAIPFKKQGVEKRHIEVKSQTKF